MTAPQPLAGARVRANRAGVAARPRGSSLGEKVAHWLADQRSARREPWTPTGLAREIGIDQKTVVGWVERGSRPRADTASRLAAVMGVPLEWLTNDDAPAIPRPDGLQLDEVLASLTPEERRSLLAALRDPKIRRAVIELGRAER